MTSIPLKFKTMNSAVVMILNRTSFVRDTCRRQNTTYHEWIIWRKYTYTKILLIFRQSWPLILDVDSLRTRKYNRHHCCWQPKVMMMLWVIWWVEQFFGKFAGVLTICRNKPIVMVHEGFSKISRPTERDGTCVITIYNSVSRYCFRW